MCTDMQSLPVCCHGPQASAPKPHWVHAHAPCLVASRHLARTDIKPLDPEGNQRGIGKDATKVWLGECPYRLSPQLLACFALHAALVFSS